MLTDEQLNKYADVLLWGLKTARKGKFKKGDIILIQYDRPALKLAEILYGKILDTGINPVQRMIGTYSIEQGFYKKANDKQLVFIAPGDKELYENLHGRIFLRAPESLTHLKDIDPARIGKVLVSRKPLREILDRREEQGLHGWTLCTFPTDELASQAKTTNKIYASQIVKAFSTGSPASFISTKWTPFTTLPFFISRQGIIFIVFITTPLYVLFDKFIRLRAIFFPLLRRFFPLCTTQVLYVRSFPFYL